MCELERCQLSSISENAPKLLDALAGWRLVVTMIKSTYIVFSRGLYRTTLCDWNCLVMLSQCLVLIEGWETVLRSMQM